MTSHLKQLPGWRSPSPSGDEDALVVIKQFTDGDEQNSLEVMDAIKQFADEDDFQVRHRNAACVGRVACVHVGRAPGARDY